ncbi:MULTISPECIES: ROK family transcriptional regulator [Rhodomicrobium]|uniref:ROK family transcriptional regulator n=1 Tax=Rhodomicrobium TaxID=1068 RepID=UPI001483B6E2|nr:MULTISPECIES: ROK family transcriptional regulator [Rhodomicrobium]
MWGAATRSDELRRNNRSRILAAVRRKGQMSRTDISRETGLSAATVSAITSDLIAENVLIGPARGDVAANGRGRPKVDLGLNPRAGIVGAMSFQLNAISAAIVDYAGVPLADSALTIDTQRASAAMLRKALARCMRDALASAGTPHARLRGIVIGIQGIADIDGTKLIWSPVMKERNLPVRSWLEAEFDVPVRIANECDLIARALNWGDPETFANDFAAILVAHGVGMGFFRRGGPVNGSHTSGTEFGHMVYRPDGALCRCGARGCIEAYAADYGIKRRASRLPETSAPSNSVSAQEIEAIVAAALAGDADAHAAIEEAGRAIGTGLANLYALTDPFPVALIGSATITRQLLEPAIRASISQSAVVRNAMPSRKRPGIVLHFIPNDAPLVRQGCVMRALLALDDQFADPPS